MSDSNYDLPFAESTTNVIDVKPYVEQQGVNSMLEINNDRVNEQFTKHIHRFKIEMSKPIYTIDCVPYKEQSPNVKTEVSQDIGNNHHLTEDNIYEVSTQYMFQRNINIIDEDNIINVEEPKNQNGCINNEIIEKVENKNGYQSLDLGDFINSCWDESENGYPEEESAIDPDNPIIEIVTGSNGVEIKNDININISIKEDQVIDVTAKEVIDVISNHVNDEVIEVISNEINDPVIDVFKNEVNEEDIKPIKPEIDAGNSYENNRAPGGALATTKGSFSTFLAPLNKESFKEAVKEVHQKLSTVNDTLTMVIHSEGMETVLQEMLQSIALKTGELLAADRTTIFLLDEEKNELWSILAKSDGVGTLEIRIPADKGIAGEVATFKKVVNIPFDFFDDPRSVESKKMYEKTGYRTYTMLALPLLSEEGDLVAVVQLINKLKSSNDPTKDLKDRIDIAGFTKEDEIVF